MKKIIFFDVRDYEKPIIENLCKDNYDYKLITSPLDDKTELDENIKNADVISCFTTSRVDEKILKQLPNLKLIALRCVGFNHIDIDYCKEKGIQVCNSFGYGNTTVAEFAFGLILDVMRKVSRAYMNLKNEHLDRDDYMGFELNGKTLGIVGTGAIGAEVIRIAKGFNMDVLAYDIYPKQELVDKFDVKYTDLDNLIKNSDVISLHAPLSEENFHLINEEKINMMKSSAIIVNTARGELIDSKALYEALLEGKIFGAGLDVMEAENIMTQKEKNLDFDYLTEDYIRQTLINERLLKLRNTVITPHIAYDSKEAQDRILNITANNISSFLKGEIKNSVIR